LNAEQTSAVTGRRPGLGPDLGELRRVREQLSSLIAANPDTRDEATHDVLFSMLFALTPEPGKTTVGCPRPSLVTC
jgi:hypothetical protein